MDIGRMSFLCLLCPNISELLDEKFEVPFSLDRAWFQDSKESGKTTNLL